MWKFSKKLKVFHITIFWRYWMASFNLDSSIPRCWYNSSSSFRRYLSFDHFSLVILPAFWFRSTNNSANPRVWSIISVANSWHCLCKVSYSFLNSYSNKVNRFNSAHNSKAVSIGSLLVRQISVGLANARNILYRARDNFKLSSLRLVSQSGQLHATGCGRGMLCPFSRSSFIIG